MRLVRQDETIREPRARTLALEPRERDEVREPIFARREAEDGQACPPARQLAAVPKSQQRVRLALRGLPVTPSA